MVIERYLHGFKDSLCGFYLIFKYDSITEEKPRKSSSRELTNLAKRRAALHSENAQKQVAKDETKVLQRVMQCCMLNGIFFGLSLVAFDYLLMPLLRVLLSWVLGEGTARVWAYARPTLTTVFNTLWVLPLFVLAKIINTVWFQDIADSAYRQRQGRPLMFPSISQFVSDVVVSVFIQLLFLMQANVVMLLPIPGIGLALSFVHMCLLNALYAFEYCWFNRGWKLNQRLGFIEDHWPYFLGFGTPLALICMWSSSVFISGCLFAVLFPVFIISANETTPVKFDNGYPMRLFCFVVRLSDRIVYFLVSKKPINVG